MHFQNALCARGLPLTDLLAFFALAEARQCGCLGLALSLGSEIGPPCRKRCTTYISSNFDGNLGGVGCASSRPLTEHASINSFLHLCNTHADLLARRASKSPSAVKNNTHRSSSRCRPTAWLNSVACLDTSAASRSAVADRWFLFGRGARHGCEGGPRLGGCQIRGCMPWSKFADGDKPNSSNVFPFHPGP